MTDTDVTLLPNYDNMLYGSCPFTRYDPYLPSAPAMFPTLDRVGRAIESTVALP